MTNSSAFDPLAQATTQIDLIAPADQQLDAYALRLRQADLARLLGCSRQVLNQWVQRGHVRLDGDGRIDARRAVVQVLAANLRGAPIQAKALEPVMAALRAAASRADELETELERSRSQEEGMHALAVLFEGALERLAEFLRQYADALDERPARVVYAQLAKWIEESLDEATERGEVPDIATSIGMSWLHENLDDDAEEPSP